MTRPGRLTAAGLVLTGLAFLAGGCAGGGTAGGEGAGPGMVSPPPARPPEIASVHPTEGSRTCRLPEIGVDFRLTDAMRRQGVADAGAISLAIDGTDVSAQAKVGGTLDFPQSRAMVTYRPQTPLTDGQRRAVVSFPQGSGRVTYAWTFVVADIPCP